MGQAREVQPDPAQRARLLKKLQAERKRAKALSARASRQRELSDEEAESEAADRNDLAIAAFVTSLAAFLFVGCLSPISLIFSIVALERRPRGMAAAALVLSLVGLVPMTTVALPFLTKPLRKFADTQIALADRLASQEHGDIPPIAGEIQTPRSEPANALGSGGMQKKNAADPKASEQNAAGTATQDKVVEGPPLKLSDIKQAQKPLGGIGLYLTAENVSDKPIFRFEALVQFIDKNDEVVAQDRIRETFRKPIAPDEKRTLVFTPGFRSQLRSVVPDTCRGSATLISVN